MHVCAQLLNCVRLFATPWIVACQAPLSMEFPRQEYWSGMSFPTQGDLPDSGIEPASLMYLALASRFFTTSTTCEVHICVCVCVCGCVCVYIYPFSVHKKFRN